MRGSLLGAARAAALAFRYPGGLRWYCRHSDDAVNEHRNDVADWWMYRALPVTALLALLWLLFGCAGEGATLAGGLHDALDRGVHVTLWTVPMERVLPALPVMPRSTLPPPGDVHREMAPNDRRLFAQTRQLVPEGRGDRRRMGSAQGGAVEK